MRPLSQEERNQIRKAIREKYEVLINGIHAQHPRLKEQIDKKATDEAIKLLGVEKLVKQKESLESQMRELENALDIVEKQISDRMPKQKGNYRGACPTPMDLCEAINQKKELILPSHQSKNPTYKRILKLEAERDEKLRQLEKVCSRDEIGSILD